MSAWVAPLSWARAVGSSTPGELSESGGFDFRENGRACGFLRGAWTLGSLDTVWSRSCLRWAHCLEEATVAVHERAGLDSLDRRVWIPAYRRLPGEWGKGHAGSDGGLGPGPDRAVGEGERGVLAGEGSGDGRQVVEASRWVAEGLVDPVETPVQICCARVSAPVACPKKRGYAGVSGNCFASQRATCSYTVAAVSLRSTSGTRRTYSS